MEAVMQVQEAAAALASRAIYLPSSGHNLRGPSGLLRVLPVPQASLLVAETDDAPSFPSY